MSKQFTGVVVSTKMNQTIVVKIERKFRHAKYRKVITKHKKYHAHYEGKDIHEGDMVTIQETSPISKTKNYIVVTNKVESKK